jgi:hypothetical protein
LVTSIDPSDVKQPARRPLREAAESSATMVRVVKAMAGDTPVVHQVAQTEISWWRTNEA